MQVYCGKVGGKRVMEGATWWGSRQPTGPIRTGCTSWCEVNRDTCKFPL